MTTTTTARMLNFGAGPAMLPAEVWEEASENLLSFDGCGVGIAELSHRSPEYSAVHAGAEARIRSLLGLNDDWVVLFMTGGASSQAFVVPMNLGTRGDYVVTGVWAKKALAEGKLLGDAHVAATSADTLFDHIPTTLSWRDDADFAHITSNNTIYGTQWHAFPDTPSPLVCDASSDILSRPLDLDRFGLIYAGAQKNLGPAGVTVVIMRKALLERTPDTLPTMLRYTTHAAKQSLYNTPPTFPIYVVGLVAKWVEKQGGLAAMAKHNAAKAQLLYDAMDANDLYIAHAKGSDRSHMNVSWKLADESLQGAFLEGAKAEGMVGLKGHRSIGGIRASIYNAMPAEGCERLAQFMADFAARA